MPDTFSGQTAVLKENLKENKDLPNNTKTVDTSNLSASEVFVVSVLERNEFITSDDLVREGIKIDDALSSLTMLEIYGYVESMPGGRYRLKR